jgi:hypothetical protein
MVTTALPRETLHPQHDSPSVLQTLSTSIAGGIRHEEGFTGYGAGISNLFVRPKGLAHATKNQQAFCADKSQCEVAAVQSVPAGSVQPGLDANSAYSLQQVLRHNAFKGCMAGISVLHKVRRSKPRASQVSTDPARKSGLNGGSYAFSGSSRWPNRRRHEEGSRTNSNPRP